MPANRPRSLGAGLLRFVIDAKGKFRSGELEFLYGDGQIRRITAGAIEVVHAIYAAVRDRDWGTVPFTIREESVRETGSGLTIDLTLAFSQRGPATGEEVAFGAGISIRVVRNQIVYAFDGTALTSFEKNRIGICVLHPVSPCSGQALEIRHPDHTSTRGQFPVLVAPYQPFLNIRGMRWEPFPEVKARLQFKGDIFEMEDQRNWSDASFKTYSTPLENPFPVLVEKGTRIRQKVTLIIEPGASPKHDKETVPVLHTGMDSPEGSGRSLPIPRIGISRPVWSAPPGAGGNRQEQAGSSFMPDAHGLHLLKDAGFNHYRTDLHLAGRTDSTLAEDLALIQKEQKLLGWPVELVLHIPEGGTLHGCVIVITQKKI